MKRLFSIICVAVMAGIVMAEEPTAARLQRTPEEEAVKQTERLIRELNIHDSIRVDTLYKMHLKYAILRRKGLTRAQEMERMNAIVAELKLLLTPQEFERFMNHPAEQPRRPHGAKIPNVEGPNKPPMPIEHQ